MALREQDLSPLSHRDYQRGAVIPIRPDVKIEPPFSAVLLKEAQKPTKLSDFHYWGTLGALVKNNKIRWEHIDASGQINWAELEQSPEFQVGGNYAEIAKFVKETGFKFKTQSKIRQTATQEWEKINIQTKASQIIPKDTSPPPPTSGEPRRWNRGDENFRKMKDRNYWKKGGPILTDNEMRGRLRVAALDGAIVMFGIMVLATGSRIEANPFNWFKAEDKPAIAVQSTLVPPPALTVVADIPTLIPTISPTPTATPTLLIEAAVQPTVEPAGTPTPASPKVEPQAVVGPDEIIKADANAVKYGIGFDWFTKPDLELAATTHSGNWSDGDGKIHGLLGRYFASQTHLNHVFDYHQDRVAYDNWYNQNRAFHDRQFEALKKVVLLWNHGTHSLTNGDFLIEHFVDGFHGADGRNYGNLQAFMYPRNIDGFLNSVS